MRKACSISVALGIVLSLASCAENDGLPVEVERPRVVVGCIVLGDIEASRQVAKGLRNEMAAAGIPYHEAQAGSQKELESAFRELLRFAPTVVVFPSPSESYGKRCAELAYSYSIRSILIGTDAPVSPRTEHLGPDLRVLARRILAEAQTLTPRVRRVVVIKAGPTLLPIEELQRHLQVEALSTRITVQSAPAEGADVVLVSVGSGLLGSGRPVAGMKRIVVDAGDAGLGLMKQGTVGVVFQPDWLDAGRQAGKLISGSVGEAWFGKGKQPIPVHRLTKTNLLK